MHADLDDEITGLRGQVKLLRNVSCQIPYIILVAVYYVRAWIEISCFLVHVHSEVFCCLFWQISQKIKLTVKKFKYKSKLM